MEKFLALVVKNTDEDVVSTIESVTLNDLSAGEVLIKVSYSSVNFKDSLAVSKNGGVIRDYPMVPGIDLSGVVVESEDSRYHKGQKVLVTGYGLGVSHTGGFSEFAQVPGDWIVPLPENMTLKEAMIIGTAGLTAALSIIALEKQGLALNKEASILVTGASGGVGSLAIAMLKQLGYQNITALSRKKSASQQLINLGAQKVILLEDFMPEKIRPLGKQLFDYAIDATGGNITAALLPQMNYEGSIALSGNAAGINLSTTVLPFILRGVKLIGIDSVSVPLDKRIAIWQRLANDLKITNQAIINETKLVSLPKVFQALQEGTHIGRTIVKIS
ncbi:acrylyl-CoA reductase family protein [Enterococcus rivorum]|uniref:NADPH:quinone reductase n=1 Tax=Enterococcus rivorum TaxID=762845 RepID=A0A1E5KUK9_9ENTE|nr:acryloyl-CoA reductase [Enterococcus rivorum]MBP2100585.1 putative YhdH/YhfP family quinone oxidoreductase [Enterococcus rivorum]OEH81566.1 NADPH:quinone reductase [Enterococcus rivorum]